MNLMTTPPALCFPARMLVQVLLPNISMVVTARMSLCPNGSGTACQPQTREHRKLDEAPRSLCGPWEGQLTALSSTSIWYRDDFDR